MAKPKPYVLPKNFRPRTTWEVAQLFGMSREEHDEVLRCVDGVLGKKKPIRRRNDASVNMRQEPAPYNRELAEHEAKMNPK